MRPDMYLTHHEIFFVITCHNVFNVGPKTTLLPVWPGDAKRSDTPYRIFLLEAMLPAQGWGLPRGAFPTWTAVWECEGHGQPAGGEAAGEGQTADFLLVLWPQTRLEIWGEKLWLSVGPPMGQGRRRAPTGVARVGEALAGCSPCCPGPSGLCCPHGWEGTEASPQERVAGPWYESASAQGPGHPPLKAVSTFKALLLKCQLRLFF